MEVKINMVWCLKDHQQKIFHHMMDEIMYDEDAVFELRERLIEACEENRLTVDKIKVLFG